MDIEENLAEFERKLRDRAPSLSDDNVDYFVRKRRARLEEEQEADA